MNRQLVIVLICLCHVEVGAQQQTTYEKELYDVEKSFSNASQTLGFRMANLSYAASNAIVFRPHEINAIEWSNRLKGQDSSNRVTWYPSIIEVSTAGDLGYGSGPFENVSTKPGDNRILNQGQFVTVWKRQQDGTFKFIMDFGSGPLPEKEFVKKETEFTPAPVPKERSKPVQANWSAIVELERAYNNACQNNGDLSALSNFAAEDIRFFYQTMFYARGMNEVKKRIEKQAFNHSWTVKGGVISQSGDMAHVYGTHNFSENGVSKTGYYMRIWKKLPDGKWVIVVQVRSLVAQLPK